MDRRDDVATMTYPTTASEQTYIEVTGGVDTHKDTHTAAALDASGRLLGHREFAATAAWAAPCFPDSYYGVDYAAICRLRYSS
jgi:hypothetical protein